METPDKIVLYITKGNSTLGDWQILHKFAENRVTKVELGTAHGFSTMIMATHPGYVFTVDNHTFYTNKDKYTPEEKYQVVRQYLMLYGDDRVKVIINDTVKEAQNWKEESIDLLFIDGGHDYKQVKADYTAWFSKVRINSVILLHDVSSNTPDVLEFYNKHLKNEIDTGKIRELIQKTEYETTMRVFVKEKYEEN